MSRINDAQGNHDKFVGMPPGDRRGDHPFVSRGDDSDPCGHSRRDSVECTKGFVDLLDIPDHRATGEPRSKPNREQRPRAGAIHDVGSGPAKHASGGEVVSQQPDDRSEPSSAAARSS